MDGARLARLRWRRLRWRRRGAWLWPMFGVAIVVDAVIGHLLPPAGDTQKLVGAGVLACFLNLLAIVLLSLPLGALLRRRRPDLPWVVARDYGGTVGLALITLVLLTAGLVHRHTLTAHQNAERDAVTRAQAYIGARAPEEYRRHVEVVDVFAIEPGDMYRVCVPSDAHARSYCVVVKTRLPFAQSVGFDGHEPNSVFAAGAG